jgi:uncharacterized DUF497 family protein
MVYEWNEGKRRKNRSTHGVDFSAIESFVWEEAVVIPDTRRDYGETRLLAYGPIEGRLFCVAFTVRRENIRIISLRKANTREVRRYESRVENAIQSRGKEDQPGHSR